MNNKTVLYLTLASKMHLICHLGTYERHNGVVWDLDVSWDTRNVATASGDNSVKVTYLCFFCIILIQNFSSGTPSLGSVCTRFLLLPLPDLSAFHFLEICLLTPL